MKPSSRVVMGGLALGALASAGVFVASRGEGSPFAGRASAETEVPAPVGPPAWPDASVGVNALDVAYPEGFGLHRVYVDAGHGADGNPGNTSSFCVAEQDFTLAVARGLAAHLSETGHFEVRLSRAPDQLTDYHDRVDEADDWRADAFLSIHSDVRGEPAPWTPRPGEECQKSDAAPGFSVLWSDEGEPSLTEGRVALARHVAERMSEAGFPAYGGHEYVGLYEGDVDVPGVFVDRHALDKRIFVLRRPTMPSVIIETHNALHSQEARRWEEDATRDAFFTAVEAALLDALR